MLVLAVLVELLQLWQCLYKLLLYAVFERNTIPLESTCCNDPCTCQSYNEKTLVKQINEQSKLKNELMDPREMSIYQLAVIYITHTYE